MVSGGVEALAEGVTIRTQLVACADLALGLQRHQMALERCDAEALHDIVMIVAGVTAGALLCAHDMLLDEKRMSEVWGEMVSSALQQNFGRRRLFSPG